MMTAHHGIKHLSRWKSWRLMYRKKYPSTLSIGVQTGPLIGAQKGPPVRMAER
ncbi:hypothetical protein OVY48_18410 [Sphingobium sp. SA2]|uniref:hypothetical protein n=1 Tax=Sphingobium sp. SA2 TaxID=1524832 RepID=UPI0028BF618C|nr:hypothetical protein [Sphingobium sp. SA2]MDT7535385.1 hypothetical protein [Sphingobium sp. SA2]